MYHSNSAIKVISFTYNVVCRRIIRQLSVEKQEVEFTLLLVLAYQLPGDNGRERKN